MYPFFWPCCSVEWSVFCSKIQFVYDTKVNLKDDIMFCIHNSDMFYNISLFPFETDLQYYKNRYEWMRLLEQANKVAYPHHYFPYMIITVLLSHRIYHVHNMII